MGATKATLWTADVLFRPANLATPEITRFTNEAVLVVGDRIRRCGPEAEVRKYLQSHTEFEVTEQHGGVIVPSVTDGHNHLGIFSILETVEAGFVHGISTYEELYAEITRLAHEGDTDMPLLILGLNTVAVGVPDLKTLDSCCAGRHVLVLDPSFHGGVATTGMLTKIQELADQEQKNGRKLHGTLDFVTGVVNEDYSQLGLQVIENYYSDEELLDGMKKTLDGWIQMGISDIHDMLINTWTEFRLILQYRKEWKEEFETQFPVQMMYLSVPTFMQFVMRMDELEKEGLYDHVHDWSRIGIKLFADGSFGSYTANVSLPYADIGGCGIEYHTDEQIRQALELAAKNHIANVAIHAIGDKGIARAVEANKWWKEIVALHGCGLNSNYFRIEHAELPVVREGESSQLLADMAELNTMLCMQGCFSTDQQYIGRLGDQVELLNPFSWILKKKIPIMLGTDGMPSDPFFNWWCCLNHPNPEQRLTMEDVIKMSTTFPADMVECNGIRGSIKCDNLADFVVFRDKEAFEEVMKGEGTPEQLARLATDTEYREALIASIQEQVVAIYHRGRQVR